MKILNKKTKTVTFREDHLSPLWIHRLNTGKLEARDITFNNIHAAQRNLHHHNIFKKGFKAIINYRGKDYLLIYNK